MFTDPFQVRKGVQQVSLPASTLHDAQGYRKNSKATRETRSICPEAKSDSGTHFKGCTEDLVFSFMDTHPHLSQGQVVKYFSTLKDGALVFRQCTLSRNLAKRTELEDRINSHPSALSSKRVRVVTRPDVERALVLWIHHMESMGETVTGPMLQEKRKRFEDLFNVPDIERLLGDGWLLPFCRAYKIKEYKQHGEAGSADPKDQWNFDETSLFPRCVHLFLGSWT